ncbi:MAG TPA: CvpA family protein, partial [Nitrococcus sp.]|nr:CvpA family protein [Nitrococcus sp.]
MNWLDYVFIGIIVASVAISLMRGFTREVLSIVVWVAAVWIS